MYYGNIKKLDIANGTGVRTTLFVSGCRNHCENCFQPETWDFAYGTPYTADTEAEILASLEPSYVNGLTLLGGEPMEPENQRELVGLLRKVRETYPRKSVWCYTGYTFEQLLADGHPRCEATDELLSMINVLVDGRFVEKLKNISLRFRGSTNQRIIDVQASLREKRIVTAID